MKTSYGGQNSTQNGAQTCASKLSRYLDPESKDANDLEHSHTRCLDSQPSHGFLSCPCQSESSICRYELPICNETWPTISARPCRQQQIAVAALPSHLLEHPMVYIPRLAPANACCSEPHLSGSFGSATIQIGGIPRHAWLPPGSSRRATSLSISVLTYASSIVLWMTSLVLLGSERRRRSSCITT